MTPTTRRLLTLTTCLAALALSAIGWARTWQAKRTIGFLGGSVRYLTHLSTDKPLYRGGETVHIRGVILHANDHTPLPGEGGDSLAQPTAHIRITGPRGNMLAQGRVTTEDSVLGFDWAIPADPAGGPHEIRVTYPDAGHPPAKRSFDIRAFRAPRLKSQIVFLRDGYGAGDAVTALLHTERAEGGFPVGARVVPVARVDGREVHRGEARVDNNGNCRATFTLPAEITRGEGTLAMIIEDGGVVETASKTIPILLKTVDLELYPEGGALIAGVENRVYLQAKTPAGKPADLVGVVEDSNGRTVGPFRTEHEGRGRFVFTPANEQSYRLRITQPTGISTRFELPAVAKKGVVIQARVDRYPAGGQVEVAVASPFRGRMVVTLMQRETELANQLVTVMDGVLTPVTLDPAGDASGVLIVTAWSIKGDPLAERLIYRSPRESVKVEISTRTENHVPGGKVELEVKTTDSAGHPVGAVVGLTVSDETIIEMIEKREQRPELPVMVLLENDVKELADAHIYLDPDNEKSPLAVDLLLGTQGWRRFAYVDPATFAEKNGPDARRMLAMHVAPVVRMFENGIQGVRGGLAPPEVEREGFVQRVKGMLGMDEQVMNEQVQHAAAPQKMMAPGKPVAAPEDMIKADLRVEEVALAPQAVRPEPVLQADPPAGIEPPAGPAQKRADMPARIRVAGRMATKLMGRDDGRAFGLEKKQEAFGMGEADMMDAEDMQAFAPPPPSDFVPVRVYAHAVRSDRKPGDRRDFTETLCWVAAMKTDANSGVARIQFDLNDSITKFRATAEAFTASGAIGSGTGAVESREPFYIEPKLPLEVTAGDEIHLPVNLVNGTGEAIAGVAVHLDVGEGLQAPEDVDTDLAANQRGRRLMTLAVLPFDGESSVRIQGTAGLLSDTVTRKLMIKPRGFPRSLSFGGYIGPANEVRHEVVIPDDTVPNSVKTSIRVYPAPLANLTGSLERLIREPNGCFEQTSSTNYPLVMAQEYFTSHQDVDPSLVSRSRTMLKNGYDRLIGFECSDGGYEWFGENPGHEALTAYGLMEFTDMVDLIEVDKDMLGRTRNWLLGIRDGSGGFKRERRALHTWVTDPDASNAYITWALVATGQKDLEPEIDAVKKSGGQSENAYVKALAANVLCEAGQGDGAASLLDNLATGQADDGHVAGGTTSIVGSRGESLDIETTALATLAWLKSKTHTGSVEKAIRYLATSCEGGRYGSTQSTVLALKAIVAHDMARARPGTAGSLRVFVGDQPVGGARPFDADTADGIDLPDVGELLSPGKHELRLMMEQGSEMPYSVEVLYNTLKPDSSAQCRVSLTVELVDGTIDEGAITEARVVVRNRHSETIPTPVAIVGIPGGLEVRHDQLKELVKTGIIAAFEVRGRQVILYWRSLDADQKVNVPLSLVAAIPGVYCGPASRAYEYYTDEHKVWAPGLEVTVTPRQ